MVVLNQYYSNMPMAQIRVDAITTMMRLLLFLLGFTGFRISILFLLYKFLSAIVKPQVAGKTKETRILIFRKIFLMDQNRLFKIVIKYSSSVIVS